MATRNPLARAVASAASRLWFPATLAFTRKLPRHSMHGGGRALARLYYRLRPKYLRAARSNLAVILGAPEDAPEVRRLAFEMVVSHFSAWVDFLHFATRPPEEAAQLIEGVERLLAHRRGPPGGQGRAAADRAPRQLGDRRPDARARSSSRSTSCWCPTSFRASRRSAPPPPRAGRRHRDPDRPQLRPDARGPARAREERHRRDAGRPGLRQHGRRRAVLRARGVFSARAAARRDGHRRDGAARFHRPRAGRPLPRGRRGAARHRAARRPRRGAARQPPALRHDPRALRARVPGAVVLLLPVLGRPVAEPITDGRLTAAESPAESRRNSIPGAAP